MESGVGMVAVNAPDVKMMNILDSWDLFECLSEFGDGDIGRSLFEKDVNDGNKVLDSVPEDEQCDKDGEDWVEIENIGKAHDNGADEDDNPA